MATTFQESPEKWMIETYTAKPQGGCPCLHCFCSCSKVAVEKLIIHWILRALEQTIVCWGKKKSVPYVSSDNAGFYIIFSSLYS